MVGKTLSHYKILEELGRGGMGIVYRAEDTNLSRIVALKVLPPQLVSSDDQTRFRREAQAAAALNHPNIATVHDFGETEDGQTFIVMELVEGEPLSNKIRDGSLDEEMTVDVVRQIAEGLAAAHSKGVVHRDIKPGNTMLTRDGRVKILDFGLAKLSEGIDITKTGTTFGTIAYTSPEQMQGQDTDGRSDLWSLGVVLYEMLTGEKPFSGAYEAAVIYSIVNQTVDLEDQRIPASLRPILGRLLQRDRELRFESARDLVDALDGGSMSATGSAGSISTTWSPPARQQVLRALALGTAGVAAAVIVLWIAWRADVFSPNQTTRTSPDMPTVAVMYVQNDTQRERLGFTVRDMLARNLIRVDQIRTVYNQRLNDILRQELGEDPDAIDAGAATQIARQAGITMMLMGSVVQLGPEFILEVDLVDVESGDVLAAESAVAVSASGIMEAVNQITTGVLIAMGEAGAGKDGPYRIQDVSTASLSAYELYEKGLNEAEHWRFDNAVEFFSSAIAIDSTFVSAYIEAAFATSVFGFSPNDDLNEPRVFLRQAARHVSRASQKEREILETLDRYLSFPEEGSGIGESFQTLADTYGDDKRLQFLAANYSGGDTSLRYLNRVLELDPSYADAYNSMAYVQLELNRLDDAVSSVRRYRALQPETENTVDSAWEVMTGAGQEKEAIKVLDQALQDHPEWIYNHIRKAYTKAIAGDTTGILDLVPAFADSMSSPEYWRLSIESHIALALGQWRRARILSASALAAARQSRSERRLLNNLRDAGAVLHASGSHEQAKQRLQEAVEISRRVYTDEFNPVPVQAAYQNGLAYADAGDSIGLSMAIDEINVALDAPGMDRRHSSYRHLLAAQLSVLEGELDTASDYLEKVKGTLDWSSHFFRLQARIAGLRGDVEGALHGYHMVEHFVAARNWGMGAYPSFFIDHAVVPYEIARMFDDLGDREEAIRRYRAALATWESTGADFRYIDIVRNRLQELN